MKNCFLTISKEKRREGEGYRTFFSVKQISTIRADQGKGSSNKAMLTQGKSFGAEDQVCFSSMQTKECKNKWGGGGLSAHSEGRWNAWSGEH